MERTIKIKNIKLYEEDEDILEDAIIENKQAIEMSKIYKDVLDSLAMKQAKNKIRRKKKRLKNCKILLQDLVQMHQNQNKLLQERKLQKKIQLEEIRPSNRRYPYVDFKPDREPGKEILQIKNISKTINGEKLLNNISFTVKPGDKIAFLADNELAKTTLFQIIEGEIEPDEGEIVWGTTISHTYFPKDNGYLFDESITDWLRKYSEEKKDPDETYVRSFLGRMLFSGEEALKRRKGNLFLHLNSVFT